MKNILSRHSGFTLIKFHTKSNIREKVITEKFILTHNNVNGQEISYKKNCLHIYRSIVTFIFNWPQTDPTNLKLSMAAAATNETILYPNANSSHV